MEVYTCYYLSLEDTYFFETDAVCVLLKMVIPFFFFFQRMYAASSPLPLYVEMDISNRPTQMHNNVTY